MAGVEMEITLEPFSQKYEKERLINVTIKLNKQKYCNLKRQTKRKVIFLNDKICHFFILKCKITSVNLFAIS